MSWVKERSKCERKQAELSYSWGTYTKRWTRKTVNTIDVLAAWLAVKYLVKDDDPDAAIEAIAYYRKLKKRLDKRGNVND